jgi:hypothetical protein
MEPGLNLETLLQWSNNLESVCLHSIRENNAVVLADDIEIILDHDLVENMLSSHRFSLRSLAFLDISFVNSLDFKQFTNLRRFAFATTSLEDLEDFLLGTSGNFEELHIMVPVRLNGPEIEEDFEEHTYELLGDTMKKFPALRIVHMVFKIWKDNKWVGDMKKWSTRHRHDNGWSFVCSYYQQPDKKSAVGIVGLEPDLPVEWLAELKHF